MVEFRNLSTVKLSEKLSPFADKIYREKFKVTSIKRTKRDNGKVSILDKKFCIDVILTLSNGTILTAQEKFRSYRAYKKYGDNATIEYYQDPDILEEGEFFHLASQIYFYGFSNEKETGFLRYFCLDVARLTLALSFKKINYKVFQNHKHSKASFIAFRYDDIPKECILFTGC